MGRSSCGTGFLVLATFLGPIVLVFMSVSLATDFWLVFDVNRSELPSSLLNPSDQVVARYTHSRNRGIFRECYPGNDTAFLQTWDTNRQEIIDGYCFYVKYEIPSGDWSGEYESRIHLMRCHQAFLWLAIASFIFAYIFGLVLCCFRRARWAYVAGLFAYIAAFSAAGSIAFFHGAEYVERNKIFDTDPYTGKFYQSWDVEIQRATDRSYGWSYILGWVGMGLAALTATFYSLAGCYIGGERYEKRREEKVYHPEYPQPLAVPYPEYGPHYYGYPRPIAGPYVYDMEDRKPLPMIGYGDPHAMPMQWS